MKNLSVLWCEGLREAKIIQCIGVVAVTIFITSCAAKYESFVEGDSTTTQSHVVTAVSDLVDSYSASTGRRSFRLHAAKRDRILISALEQRLREKGHSVEIVGPSSMFTFKRESQPQEGIDLRYRASYVENIGTYCLDIVAEQVLCRMYKGGEPISSITATGVKNIERANSDPINITDDVQWVQRPTSPPIVPQPQVLGKTFPSRVPEVQKRPVTDELNIIQTAHLNNDELRSTLERYVTYLPPGTQVTIPGDRQEGETEEMYRSRLLRQMKIIYSYQFHQGIGYE